ncbi:J domain-containing protein 1 [Diatrype stigma]|uniref:J domain-containing protein 1 n=1 Tax=Diatrype stigma TaxID=117547 RepID=A0AAN9UQW0_9PEZI
MKLSLRSFIGYRINQTSKRQTATSGSRFRNNIQRRYDSPRGYATASKQPGKDPERGFTGGGRHHWPTSAHPTPYEIFDQKRGAPYRKTRFFELVKIYHPDRHHHQAPNDALSHAVRLERYRLIVAANDILCDPARRRAYDLYGTGWAGKLGLENINREADRSWRKRPGNPSMNATWEDWERWYDEQDGGDGWKKKQRPVYMSNELFVGVLCAMVIIGSMGQARRATTNGLNVVEMHEKKHAVVSRDMRQRQGELARLDRHGRIENFLRQREGWALASPPPRNPTEAYHQEK